MIATADRRLTTKNVRENDETEKKPDVTLSKKIASYYNIIYDTYCTRFKEKNPDRLRSNKNT